MNEQGFDSVGARGRSVDILSMEFNCPRGDSTDLAWPTGFDGRSDTPRRRHYGQYNAKYPGSFFGRSTGMWRNSQD